MDKKFVSLVEAFTERISSGVDPTQVCRVCSRNSRRGIYGCSPDADAKKAPLRVFDATGNTAAYHADGSVPVKLVAKNGKPTTPVRHITSFNNAPTDAFGLVSTCGQNVAPKCAQCGHFRPVEASFVDGETESGRAKIRSVALGGHCDIGPEGMLVGTQVMHCVFTPKGRDISDSSLVSCGTCRWNTSNWNTIEHATGLEDLSAYEHHLAEISADPNSDNPGREIGTAKNEARRAKMQIPWPSFDTKRLTPTWASLSRTYLMRVAPGGLHYQSVRNADGSTREVFSHVEVMVPDSNVTLTLDAISGTDRDGMPTVVANGLVAVEITAPHHRDLGLPDRDSIIRTGFVKEDCPTCAGSGIERRASGEVTTCRSCDNGDGFYAGDVHLSPKPKALRGKRAQLPGRSASRRHPLMHLVDANCAARGADPTRFGAGNIFCSYVHGPCYFHAKAPKQMYFRMVDPDGSDSAGQVTGEYSATVFTRPDNASRRADEAPERIITIDRSTGRARAVDANGNLAHPNILKLRMRSLLQFVKSPAEAADLRAQLDRGLSSSTDEWEAAPTRSMRTELAWVKESGEDPWHNFCAINAYDKAHGGHKDGSEDVVVKEGNVWIARGVKTRGIDFTEAWNDRFGTPRSNMSSNPVAHSHSGGGVPVLNGAVVTEKSGMAQHLVLDPMFSWPKYQERMEWERVHAPGARVQEEILINEALLAAGRKIGRHNPSAHKLSGNDRGRGEFVLPVPEITRSFASAADLVDWLDEKEWIPGSDATRLPGFWLTHRAQYLGYATARNAELGRGERSGGASILLDVISVTDWHHRPHDDEATAEAEAPEVLICTYCWTGDGDAGTFRVAEIDDPDAGCPSGDGGRLIRWHRRAEWMAAEMAADGDQIREISPTYRRSPNSEMAFATDTRRWNTIQRLNNMFCEHWAKRPWYPQR